MRFQRLFFAARDALHGRGLVFGVLGAVRE
jgi:hypothetical protein